MSPPRSGYAGGGLASTAVGRFVPPSTGTGMVVAADGSAAQPSIIRGLDIREPFTYGMGRRAGLTRSALSGSGYRRLFPNVYVDSGVVVTE